MSVTSGGPRSMQLSYGCVVIFTLYIFSGRALRFWPLPSTSILPYVRYLRRATLYPAELRVLFAKYSLD